MKYGGVVLIDGFCLKGDSYLGFLLLSRLILFLFTCLGCIFEERFLFLYLDLFLLGFLFFEKNKFEIFFLNDDFLFFVFVVFLKIFGLFLFGFWMFMLSLVLNLVEYMGMDFDFESFLGELLSFLFFVCLLMKSELEFFGFLLVLFSFLGILVFFVLESESILFNVLEFFCMGFCFWKLLLDVIIVYFLESRFFVFL